MRLVVSVCLCLLIAPVAKAQVRPDDLEVTDGKIEREYGRVNQPKLIRDVAMKQKVLEMVESVARGIDRLEAVPKRMDPNTVQAVLARLQAPPLGRIADMKTLQHVVLGLEEFAGPNPPRGA